jgi:sulfate/thiosulfate transport system substrate-binding protein
MRFARTFAALAGGALLTVPALGVAKPVTILNVSYDPTRELYQEFNASFAKKWEAETGQKP